MKIIIVIPCYNETSGGIKRMLRLTEELHIRGYEVGLHIQQNRVFPKLPIKVTCGMPGESLPDCDTIISYSDDPYIKSYKKILPNVNLLVYMLSFGMCIEREQAVVESGAKILCSTQKIVDEIKASLNIEVHKIGFSLDEQRKKFYLENSNRTHITIMYHRSPSKNYDTARKVCDYFDLPVIVFGQRPFSKIKVPKNTESVFYNVDHSTLRRIFNRSMLYINTSLYEGLNLTPIEALLCGTPAILCDGSEEVFDTKSFNDNDIDEITKICENWIDNYLLVNHKIISDDAHKIAEKHTWEKVISNLREFLW